MAKNESLVYSTDTGRACPSCEKPVAKCACPKKKSTPIGDGKVRVQRESKGRNGKTVTVITGLPLGEEALKSLGKDLKARCGTGGTTKDGVIEIQGDHRDLLVKELCSRGFEAKPSGG